MAHYPDIAPTTVRVSASYPGARAQAVETSVTRVIEDSMTGLDGMIYMTAQSSEGTGSVTLTFDDSVDPVDAQNEVQTKVAQVESQLPGPVQTQGVAVRRSTSSILMVGALVSSDGSHSTLQLGDILSEIVEDPIQRTDGVGDINSFGSGYAMRSWPDPISLARYPLTPTDLVEAVENQNTTVSVGSLGDQPTVRGRQFTATGTAQGQLSSVGQFKRILLKTDEDGGTVRLADVASVEIGQEDYGGDSRFDGLNAAGFGVNLETGANAVGTANAVKATMAQLAPSLPEGVEFRIAYDTSPFVELSIEQV